MISITRSYDIPLAAVKSRVKAKVAADLADQAGVKDLDHEVLVSVGIRDIIRGETERERRLEAEAGIVPGMSDEEEQANPGGLHSLKTRLDQGAADTTPLPARKHADGSERQGWVIAGAVSDKGRAVGDVADDFAVKHRHLRKPQGSGRTQVVDDVGFIATPEGRGVKRMDCLYFTGLFLADADSHKSIAPLESIVFEV